MAGNSTDFTCFAGGMDITVTHCMSQEFVAISTIKIVFHRPSYSKVQKPAIIQFYLLYQTGFIFDRIKDITICIRRIYSFQEACALPTHLKYIDIEPKTQQLNRCHHSSTLANRTIIYVPAQSPLQTIHHWPGPVGTLM